MLHLKFNEGLMVIPIHYPSCIMYNECSLCTELSGSVSSEKFVMELIVQL
jgi:hypothetical protein